MLKKSLGTVALAIFGVAIAHGLADIGNLKKAMAAAQARTAFMPAIAPSGVGSNEYYKSDEDFLQAVGAAMRTEYRAIVDAGLLLQIDDPFLCDVLVDPRIAPKERRRLAAV